MDGPEQDQRPRKTLQEAWVELSAALLVSLRLGSGTRPTKQQVDAYISRIIMPVQGNRATGSKMPWTDARKIVQRLSKDIVREMNRLAKEDQEKHG